MREREKDKGEGGRAREKHRKGERKRKREDDEDYLLALQYTAPTGFRSYTDPGSDLSRVVSGCTKCLRYTDSMRHGFARSVDLSKVVAVANYNACSANRIGRIKKNNLFGDA